MDGSAPFAVLAFARLGDTQYVASSTVRQCIRRGLPWPVSTANLLDLRSSVACVAAPAGLAAAAMARPACRAAFITGTDAGARAAVDLMALITPANSTSQIFAGTTYYGTDWETVYGPQQVVPFLLGPQGIANAISGAHDDRRERATLIRTGRSGIRMGRRPDRHRAGDPGDHRMPLTQQRRLGHPRQQHQSCRRRLLDDVYPFAPLLLTSAEPTPTKFGRASVWTSAYKYNINSDAPTDPLNPFVLGNSLAAYVYGYGAE